MKLNFLTLVKCLLMLSLFAPIQVNAKTDTGSLKSKEANLQSLSLLMNNIEQGDVLHGKQQIESIRMSNPELLNDEILGETPLSKSAKLGQLEIVEHLINAGVKIDKAPSSTITPLMKAAYYGHIEVVEFLLLQGADIRLEHQGGYEAFDWALESGQYKVMNLLTEQLIQQSNSNHSNATNSTDKWTIGNVSKTKPTAIPGKETQSLILLKTILADDLPRLKQLLQHGFNPNFHNVTGYAALPFSVRLNKDKMIDTLLAAGADINIGNNGNDEASPINQAARAGNLKLLKKIIAAGANVNKPNARGYTALHLAAMIQSSETVKYLLQQGANANFPMRDGYTPYDFAYQTGNKKVLTEFLLADLSARNRQIAEQAIANKKFPKQKFFSEHSGFLASTIVNQFPIEQIANLSTTTISQKSFGYFPLNYAARFGQLDVAKLLIKRGAKVNQTSKGGYQTSPLTDALRQTAYLQMVQLLLDNHANIRLTDKNGDPAINWATLYGHTKAVKYLLSRGADPLQANKDEYTALRTANERGHKDIIVIIEQFIAERNKAETAADLIKQKSTTKARGAIAKLADPNLFLKDGSTLLFEAIKIGDPKLVSALIEYGANVNQSNIIGYFSTPLMQSVSANLPEVSELLLNAGANINDTDVLGDPAINWAAYLGRTEIVKLLTANGADVKITTIHGNALDIAMRQGHHRIVDSLLPSFDKQKESPLVTKLFSAVAERDFVSLKGLVNKINNKVVRDGYQNAILTYAANRKCLACVELLLQAEQPVDQTDRIGFSALMIAARNGDSSMVELLLKYKASVNLQANSRGMKATPLILAAAHSHSEVIRQLHNAGAKLNLTDVMGNTALHWTLSAPNNEATQLLLSLGADTDIVNQYGISAKSVLENI